MEQNSLELCCFFIHCGSNFCSVVSGSLHRLQALFPEHSRKKKKFLFTAWNKSNSQIWVIHFTLYMEQTKVNKDDMAFSCRSSVWICKKNNLKPFRVWLYNKLRLEFAESIITKKQLSYHLSFFFYYTFWCSNYKAQGTLGEFHLSIDSAGT